MRCVHAACEGRQFVFEMGGHGNNRLIHEALAEAFQAHGYEYENPFYFPPIAEYSSMLEEMGFPEELIVNSSEERFRNYLKEHTNFWK